MIMNINTLKTKPNHNPTRTTHSIGAGALLLALGLSATPAMAESLNCSQTPKINADPKINCFSPNTPALSGEVNANMERLLQRIAALEQKLEKVYYNPFSNILYIKGTNLQIINGEDATETTNGTGNLIIGYNKAATREVCSDGSGNTQATCSGTWGTNQRTGSHNLVIGDRNQYTQYSGIVAGYHNAIVNQYANVSSGIRNTASGQSASVSGGVNNTASGQYASVSGGAGNEASGRNTSVSGGAGNEASGLNSNVSGGFENTASRSYSSVGGGKDHTTTNMFEFLP